MEDKFLVFEQYLAGELLGEELTKFENLLQTDIDFNESFNLYKETHTLLESNFKNKKEQQEFENNLKKISGKYFKKTRSIGSKKWYYSVAASIALLISVYLFYPNTELSYEEYVEYPNVNFTVRGNENTTLLDAQKAFNNKDFDTASKLFSETLKKDNENTELKLYKGFSLIEINQFQEATILLKPIATGSSSYKYTAIWYLALSNLKQEKYSECKELLTQLPTEFTQYKKAQKLLKNLPK